MRVSALGLMVISLWVQRLLSSVGGGEFKPVVKTDTNLVIRVRDSSIRDELRTKEAKAKVK